MVIFRGFDTDRDIPDLSDKVIFLTGGTGGVGKTAIQHLAKHNPSRIYFTGRNHSAAEALISSCPDPTRLTFIPMDQTSLSSIRAAADRFLAEAHRLDILIANAGIMAVPPGLTEDGYEVQFGTNHVGNAALALRVLPLMLRTAERGADVRFVSVTSLGYAMSSGVELSGVKTTQEDMRLGTLGRYGQSKLANILFARELARRYPSITSVVVHPGVVSTSLVSGLGWWHRLLVYVTNPRLLTPEEGGVNTVWAATGRDVRDRLKDGGVALFEPVGKANAGRETCFDEEAMRKLWEWTEDEVGVKAP